ncbi:translation termination inhibitor protein itt1 [Monascus purpureus]|uniref:RBR-type E3 ubiquitin transferase n=1 Tax=Monascus purpureus TaxID=5098 RepID=A0A507QPJ5_MONPU|nr:translation termination inhibitor protein itt1 [Monascus purpureus]BDD61761.1 hypothetical protein MAP00_006787 [Monascus purpureus]
MAESIPFCEDERSVELSSIAAIYPEIKIDPSFSFKASLSLPVVPSTPLHVYFDSPSDADFTTVLTPPTSVDTSDASLNSAIKGGFGSSAPNAGRDIHALSYLPPLELEIELPDGYPSEKPPIFNIRIYPQWLTSSRISELLDDGHRLWEEGGKELVVYTYIDHLQQLAETAFGIADSPDGEVLFSRDLKIALLDFNNKAEREKFEQETFECGVCLEPKKGASCHRMLHCSHVFCVPCLQDFYNACITEGDVDGVKCLAPDCAKDVKTIPESTGDPAKKRKKHDRTLSPSELLQIPLEQETVQRYVFLKRKKKLEADKSTVYCPRQWCQGAARSKKHPKPVDPMADDFDDSDEDDGFVFDPMGEESQLPPMADRVAICEECNYAFCCVCKKGWHGELERCFPRRQAELSAEEKATEEYLRLYTSPCPTCNAPCQKRMGCNHMKCFKCDTHFCYLCSSWLSEDNPYQHFNNINSRCYNRLWDLEGGDGIDPEGAEALHRIPEALIEFDDLSDDDEEDNPVWEFGDDDDIPRRQPPPPAPAPPRVNRAGGHGNRRQRRNQNDLDAAGRAAAAERQAQAQAMAEMRNRVDAGRNQQGPALRPGLQRFLDLVINDREDEWDSDELDDDF